MLKIGALYRLANYKETCYWCRLPHAIQRPMALKTREGDISKCDEVFFLISLHDALVVQIVKIDVPRFVICSCEKRTLLKRHVDVGGTIAASVQSLHRRKLAIRRASM